MNDEKVLEFIELINKKKKEIQRAEKPVWKTNCSWKDQSGHINLHVENNINGLLALAAELNYKDNNYTLFCKKKNIDGGQLKINGFTALDWIDDILTRISIIQLVSKRKELENLEGRLNKIVSPELRAKLELEAIEKEMSAL